MSAQEIGRLLDRDKVNDDLIYMALDQLQQLNIRMIMPEVARFLKILISHLLRRLLLWKS